MAPTADPFFPERSRRVVSDDVIGAFPFPLAITYARLQDELDGQEPVAAAWQLRDAFEGLIKFLASVAVADALHDRPDRELAARLAGLLLKPSGLALGDWHTLIEMALEPLETPAKAGRLAESGRRLPALYGVFFDPRKGGRTDGNYAIDGTEQSFVRWRNREFGHGVFRRDRAWYAAQTTAWLDPLHRLYDALRPVLTGWALIGLMPGGERIEWQGAGGRSRTGPHSQEPRGESLPMVLVHTDGSELPFGPMLSVQHCSQCGQPAAFFFDKNKYDSGRDRHRTVFLEYFGGHDQTHDNWDLTRRLASLLPVQFEWRRESHDPAEIAEGITITFRDFETEYRRPDYLLDAIWQLVEERPRGYIHLVGPEGFGKTYLVRGLEREAHPPRRAVLAYHVLPGTTGRYQTFLVELNARAREQVQLRTPDLQIKDATTPEAMQQELADYLATLIRDNRLDRLVVAIDALDELPEPVSATRAITDFLPPADRLPKGCTIVLTSREAMRPRTAAGLDRLRRAGPEGFTALPLRPDASDNRELLRSYLLGGDHLPEPLRTAEHTDALIDRAGGVFLYVFHLGRALASGAFADLSALPEGHTFYPAYLARLRERAGGLYDSVYLPMLLLLCAAFQPVTLRQMSRWGIPRDRLPFALIDLKDFLRIHRVRLWHDSLAPPDEEPENRYEIAHEAFLRFVRDDATLAPLLQAAHARIARAALPAPSAPWSDLDPTDDVQLYDLRHVLPHLDSAGLEDMAALVRRDASYASHCLSAGYSAWEKARYPIAEDLHDRAANVYRNLVEREGRAELANDLAAALMNKANAIQRLGRLAEAVAVYDQAIAIRQCLVERESRTEFANDLAAALMNKGAALRVLGRLAEAVAVSDQAIAIVQSLVEREGRAGLAYDLAIILVNKANAMQGLGRLAEAVAVYDQAIASLQRLAEREGHAGLANDLAGALMNKGMALRVLGRLTDAVAVSDQAIAIVQSLVEREGRTEFANDLAAALMNKGVALRVLGRLAEAVAVYDQAIAIRQRLVESEGRTELANGLAAAAMNKGVVLQFLGRLADAVAAYDQAIAIRQRLVESEGRAELADDLAAALTNKANAMQGLGRLAEAVAVYDQAIDIVQRLVEREGRAGLANILAIILVNKANAMNDLGWLADAVGVSDQAIAVLQSLVEREGRVELANDLAAALMNKANALAQLGRLAEAVAVYDQAIAIRQRLVEREGRTELANDLAKSLANKALVLVKQEQGPDALACFEEAIRWNEACIEAGMVHLLGKLLRTIRYRMMTSLGLGLWVEAAAGVVRLLDHAAPAVQSGSPAEAVMEELDATMGVLRQLPDDAWGQVEAGLGPWAEVVRAMVRGPG